MKPPAGSAPWLLRAPSTYLGAFLILLVIAAYGHLALWAAGMVIERTRPPAAASVVAAADLPSGHLLRPSDVRLPGLAGYTKRRIDAGKPVVAADLTAAPNMTVPADAILAVLPVSPALLDVARPGRLDVGSKVQLCAKGKPPLEAVVQTVICSETGCAVALPVKADKVGALDKAVVRPPSNQPCG